MRNRRTKTIPPLKVHDWNICRLSICAVETRTVGVLIDGIIQRRTITEGGCINAKGISSCTNRIRSIVPIQRNEPPRDPGATDTRRAG